MATPRLFAVLATVAALAGCGTPPPPSPERVAELTAAASSSQPPRTAPAAVSPSPPPRTAAAAKAPSTAGGPTDPDAACQHVDETAFPAADLPTPAERKALASCDAEALYYGIGRPVDFAAARKCAYAQRDDGKAPPIGGAAVLLMVYANGKGVPANLDLALRFACESGFAPAERDGRVSRVLAARKQGGFRKDLDFCEDITSGYMMGWCAGHEERLRAVARESRKRAATRGLPGPALEALDKAAAAFFSERSTSEVDLSGTARGALSLGERASLDDAHVTMLEQLADPAFAPPVKDAAGAERDLQQAYDGLMKCKKRAPPGYPGGIEAEGIRKTERLWLPYREAWLSLVAEAKPGANRGAWKAWLAEQRTRMLKELADGC